MWGATDGSGASASTCQGRLRTCSKHSGASGAAAAGALAVVAALDDILVAVAGILQQ